MVKRWHKKESTPAFSSIMPSLAVGEWRTWLPQAILIVAAGLWIYGPVLHGAWLWDDDRYVSENQIVQDPDGFWKVWITKDWQGKYYPLSALVAWIQWQCWGKDTFGYHLTNVLLHLASAFLIWRLLARLGIRLAWLGALLFTVHPIMVESVAWISELKNTLSLPPLLLALMAWQDWQKDQKPSSYRSALLWFLISLLAKTSGAFLPLVLLGYSWWKNGTIRRDDIRAVAPFFLIAVLTGLLTLFPIHGGDPASSHNNWNFLVALTCAGRTAFFLLGKCILPLDLLPDYPSLVPGSGSIFDLVPWAAFLLLALLLGFSRAGWGRPLLLGLGFFFINLIPVLLFVLIKYPTMMWSLDHLVYLPVIGLIGLAVAGIDWLDQRLAFAARLAVRLVVAVGIVLMAWGSHTYAGWFRDTETLWTNTLVRYPTSWLASANLSPEMLLQGRTDEAAKYALQSLSLRPELALSHYNMAAVWEKTGDMGAAIREFHETLRIEPKNGKAVVDLGGLLYKEGNKAEAITLFQTAIKSDPDIAQLRYNLGSILLQSGNIPAAIEQLRVALQLEPNLAPAHENLGTALAKSGNLPAAVEQFQAAVAINPGYIAARNNLALALAQTGHLTEAIEQFRQVLALDPGNAMANGSLAKLLEYQKSHAAPISP
jgi:tetratricopeptide (TPR) repeat protein